MLKKTFIMEFLIYLFHYSEFILSLPFVVRMFCPVRFSFSEFFSFAQIHLLHTPYIYKE